MSSVDDPEQQPPPEPPAVTLEQLFQHAEDDHDEDEDAVESARGQRRAADASKDREKRGLVDECDILKQRDYFQGDGDSDIEEIPVSEQERFGGSPELRKVDSLDDGEEDEDSFDSTPTNILNFSTWDDVRAWWLQYSGEHGFCTVTSDTQMYNYAKLGRSTFRRGKILCKQSGEYRPYRKGEASLNPKATPHTTKIGCPFVVQYKFNPKTELYVVVFDGKEKTTFNHNHPRQCPAAFHSHRKMKGDILAVAASLVSKLSPTKALNQLHKMFGARFISTYDDIRNLQAGIWRDERGGLGATKAMLLAVAQAGLRTMRSLDEHTGELTLLMDTDPQAVVLAQHFGHVLLIDCTYKTNIYNYPMLHIVSHTSTGTTFTVAYAFMKQETTEYYTKALEMLLVLVPQLPTKVVVTDADQALRNALKSVDVVKNWKHLLCRWHIAMNVKANCKSSLNEDQWKLFQTYWYPLTSSQTVEAFEKHLDEFREVFTNDDDLIDIYDYAVGRLKDKEMFVSCYIDKYLRLGNTSTSRAEGGHSALKRDLRSSRGDLFAVVSLLRNALHAQQSRVFEMLNKSRTSGPLVARATFGKVGTSFTEVIHKIF